MATLQTGRFGRGKRLRYEDHVYQWNGESKELMAMPAKDVPTTPAHEPLRQK